MKPIFILFCSIPAVLTGCRQPVTSVNTATVNPAANIIVPQGKTLEARFNPPEGYHRTSSTNGEYVAYLRNLPLKEDGALVHYYNGGIKNNPGIYAAVLDMEIGTTDLQQCADAVMRLRAEYLFATGQKDKIHFHLTNGFDADFSHWMQGKRIAVKGNNTSWVSTATPAQDHKTLRQYLDFVYTYAGSLSLSKELKSISWEDMQPGDILIIGGSPGHAETVMDMAVDNKGHKVFMLSQSYMPAQDIQILHNPDHSSISPWYELNSAPYTVHTPQYDFQTSDLKRWAK